MRKFTFGLDIQGGEERSYCSYPLKLDPYKAGCSHDCQYCYVKDRLADMGSWRPESPSVLDTDHLARLFDNVFSKGRRQHRTERVLATKLPVRVGMNTDPFQAADRTEKATKRTLAILREYQYPYVLLTKSARVAEDQHVDLYDRAISYLEVTITSLSAKLSRKIEPGASLPEERLAAVRHLRKAGLPVAVRINPLFPIYPDGHYSRHGANDARLAPEFDMFTWDLVHAVCECRPTTLIVGFLRLGDKDTHALRWIREQAGVDLRQFFTDDRKYYTREEVRYYYSECKRIAESHGVAFSVCFDRNENYKSFRSMWANQDDCCNAYGQSKLFNKTFRTIQAGLGL